jgi:hypothetical protein
MRQVRDRCELPKGAWVIGTRHPDRLLAAIERALVGAGGRKHAGSPRTLAHPVVERKNPLLRWEEIRGPRRTG